MNSAEIIESFDNFSKEEKYAYINQALGGLTAGESDGLANISNCAALFKEVFNWWWVGFYIVRNEELVLGPFQGPVACTRIAKGKGVCGSSWAEARSLVVPDVDEFPGHIACSAFSKSEIVIPVFSGNRVVAVLDADSEYPNHFDETDRIHLEKICGGISTWFESI